MSEHGYCGHLHRAPLFLLLFEPRQVKLDKIWWLQTLLHVLHLLWYKHEPLIHRLDLKLNGTKNFRIVPHTRFNTLPANHPIDPKIPTGLNLDGISLERNENYHIRQVHLHSLTNLPRSILEKWLFSTFFGSLGHPQNFHHVLVFQNILMNFPVIKLPSQNVATPQGF